MTELHENTKVRHKLLLFKLTKLGLSSTATSWFPSYLSNCSQITRVLDSYSSLSFPSSGIPQGSSLDPTLSSAFIHDLLAVLPPYSTVLFADDSTIFIVSNNVCSLQSSLQICLNLGKPVTPKRRFEIEHLKNKEYAHPLE